MAVKVLPRSHTSAGGFCRVFVRAAEKWHIWLNLPLTFAVRRQTASKASRNDASFEGMSSRKKQHMAIEFSLDTSKGKLAPKNVLARLENTISTGPPITVSLAELNMQTHCLA